MNLQQQLGAQQEALQQVQGVMDAQHASIAHRENALQAQLADMSDRLNLNMTEAELAVDPEPVARRCRVFIESRAFSKFANFDSKAASWKGGAFKFENMAAAVVPSSRDSLEWAARLTTSKQVPIPLKSIFKSTLHWQSFWKERRWTLCRTLRRGAGLEAWRKLVRRCDPQTTGRKRTLLSRIRNPGTAKVHELCRAIEQRKERVRSYQSRAREKFMMTYVPES